MIPADVLTAGALRALLVDVPDATAVMVAIDSHSAAWARAAQHDVEGRTVDVLAGTLPHELLAARASAAAPLADPVLVDPRAAVGVASIPGDGPKGQPMTMEVGQLALFAAPAARAPVARSRHLLQRHRPALLCLRDSVPEALKLVHVLGNPSRRDTRSPRAGGDWAYCVSNAGLRYELAAQWGTAGGWSRTPAHLMPWSDLAALIEHDPRRAEIADWIDGVEFPAWRHTARPHELWPEPGSWHRSYLSGDHVDAGWTDRRRAWQLVLDLLTDTIEELTR